jgi:hypothetical protein
MCHWARAAAPLKLPCLVLMEVNVRHLRGCKSAYVLLPCTSAAAAAAAAVYPCIHAPKRKHSARTWA